jgi:hypothetical protein
MTTREAEHTLRRAGVANTREGVRAAARSHALSSALTKAADDPLNVTDALRMPGELPHATILKAGAMQVMAEQMLNKSLALGGTGAADTTQPDHAPLAEDAKPSFGTPNLDAARARLKRHAITGRLEAKNPVNAVHGSPQMKSANGLFSYTPGTQVGTS